MVALVARVGCAGKSKVNKSSSDKKVLEGHSKVSFSGTNTGAIRRKHVRTTASSQRRWKHSSKDG
jgi:hypothetical protein